MIVNNATQVCEGFNLLQSTSSNNDCAVVGSIYFQKLGV